MALSEFDIIQKKYSRDWEEGCNFFKRRIFRSGPGTSLSGMNVQQGDALLDDATYIIIRAEMRYEGGHRFADVTAMLEGTV